MYVSGWSWRQADRGDGGARGGGKERQWARQDTQEKGISIIFVSIRYIDSCGGRVTPICDRRLVYAWSLTRPSRT